MNKEILLQNIIEAKENLHKHIKQANTIQDLQNIEKSLFSKKGKLNISLYQLSEDDILSIRTEINTLKKNFFEYKKKRIIDIEKNYYKNIENQEYFDVTILPEHYHTYDSNLDTGSIHPISLFQERIEEIFNSMGFCIMDGPQLENDFYNFSALNFSEYHPARDTQDTFYTKNEKLLRTHTSPAQVRTLQKLKPPIRAIVPGRVFRFEEVDASHEHTFYQIEGIFVDKKVSISHLLYFMQMIINQIFEKNVETRMRPGYFPFVEPGFELDIACQVCNKKGCSVCKYSGWVELIPCGLVHPNVLEYSNVDSKKWQGAAFGLGLNRLVMMYYGIEDIRYFQSDNLEFLQQFQKY